MLCADDREADEREARYGDAYECADTIRSFETCVETPGEADLELTSSDLED